MLISSSRPDTLAANLQGIWNESLDPPWGSKYTVNINAEMNYWIAERTNLSDLHAPLFDLIDSTRAAGAVTAKKYYNARGFVVHHNTDLWGDSVPVDHVQAGIWPMGAAWLVLHLWDHFEYSGDMEFLKQRAYPRLREISEFLLDYLVESPDGHLVTGPSQSPENQYRAARRIEGQPLHGAGNGHSNHARRIRPRRALLEVTRRRFGVARAGYRRIQASAAVQNK